ncbi:MAG: hypothetical protein J1F02_05105 [Lachnospiraceae bacterium]|nr:hypothetical protein [Lachnospiraceae bacterium]
MTGEFDNVKIQGMAAAVPGYVEENKSFESVLGARRTKKQSKLTGVFKRHISGPHQRTSDLCYAAAVRLLDKLEWNKEDIKVLIMVTQTPNYELPSTAFFLQQRLGIGKDCVVFDINLGCSSFNAGVHVVSALLQNCEVSDKALLLLGDISGQVLEPDKKLDEDVLASSILFGAAGAAVALEKVKHHSMQFLNKSDGTGFEAIIEHQGGDCRMQGEVVFEFAINDVAEDVKAFRNRFNLTESDIDYYVFHQAQKMILDNIAAVCDIPEGKELRSLEEYGNTSGTSVPVTVCANVDRFRDKDTVRLLLCGFGVGLSWGMIYSEIPVENILPVFETDEHYDEDKEMVEDLKGKCVLVMDADTEMGQYISRYLDDKSTRVILAGSDSDRLSYIQGDLFWDSCFISGTGEALIHKIASLCKDKGLCLDGIVYPNKRCVNVTEVSAIKEAGILNDQASVVIVSNEDTYRNRGEQETYDKGRRHVEVLISQVQDTLSDHGIRVNAVLYDEDKCNLVQVTGSGQEWIEKFLQEGCPQEMKRPQYINHAVKYLLSEESLYTNGNLLSVGM